MAGQYAPRDVLGDLIYLRKGVGLTPERFASRVALIGVLGGPSEPPEVLIERFGSAIGSLHDPDAELLTEIFGLSPDTRSLGSLGARRDYSGHRLGIRREAVADRDATALENLQRQLITGWYPKSPIGIRIPESHNGFVQHSVTVTTFVRDRKHLESRHQYRLFALFDGVEYLGWATAEPTSPVVVGNDFTVKTVQIASGWLHQFWHKTPMQRGQTYDLTFRIVNPDPAGDPYWLHEESLAFHEPTWLANFEIVFLGELPSVAWKFEGLTALQRPGTPTEASTLQLDRRGAAPSAKAQYRDIYGGLYCGVAWEW
ncbi:MAG: hypothetical protein ACSLEW_07590 [Nocardioides sp.]